jgi:hypothetical protein
MMLDQVLESPCFAPRLLAYQSAYLRVLGTEPHVEPNDVGESIPGRKVSEHVHALIDLPSHFVEAIAGNSFPQRVLVYEVVACQPSVHGSEVLDIPEGDAIEPAAYKQLGRGIRQITPALLYYLEGSQRNTN